MLNIYSYKFFTRDKGKKLIIKDELKRINNPILNKQFVRI